MVTDKGIERCAGAHGGCHQACAVAGELAHRLHDYLDHPSGTHAGPEAHRADNQVDGVEHSYHPSRRHQLVDRGIAGLQRHGVVDAFHRARQHQLPLVEGAFYAVGNGCFFAYAPDDLRLSYYGRNGSKHHGEAKHDQRGHLARNHNSGEQRNYQQPGSDMEFGRDDACECAHISRTLRNADQAYDRERYQSDGERRHCGYHHVAYM